mgnify:CR=1 FL=1
MVSIGWNPINSTIPAVPDPNTLAKTLPPPPLLTGDISATNIFDIIACTFESTPFKCVH